LSIGRRHYDKFLTLVSLPRKIGRRFDKLRTLLAPRVKRVKIDQSAKLFNKGDFYTTRSGVDSLPNPDISSRVSENIKVGTNKRLRKESQRGNPIARRT
jgi:hypothetical protein